MGMPTFAAAGRHLGKGVVTAVAVAANDAGLAGTLPAGGIAAAGQGPRGVALAGVAPGTAHRPVVVLLGGGGSGISLGVTVPWGHRGHPRGRGTHLAVALARRLVAVRVEALGDVAAAGATRGVAPPPPWARLCLPARGHHVCGTTWHGHRALAWPPCPSHSHHGPMGPLWPVHSHRARPTVPSMATMSLVRAPCRLHGHCAHPVCPPRPPAWPPCPLSHPPVVVPVAPAGVCPSLSLTCARSRDRSDPGDIHRCNRGLCPACGCRWPGVGRG